MILNSIKNYHYTGEVWNITNIADAEDPDFVPIFALANRVSMFMSFDGSYVFCTARTDATLSIGSQLRVIRDRANELIMDGEYVFEVTQVMPVINVFGYVEDYDYRLRRISL